MELHSCLTLLATATNETTFVEKDLSGDAISIQTTNAEPVLSPWTQSLFAFMASTIMIVKTLDTKPIK